MKYIKTTDYKLIYGYYCRVRETVPYWFECDFEIWKESFVSDTDYEGEEMFSELNVYVALSEERIVGFVQFGISRYIYGTDGEKDRSVKGGIIRNFYFDKDADCGEELIAIAEQYFKEHNIQKKFAFFHAFGMTCSAGHGKLYCGLPHIEKALLEFGYVKEHENVYYRRFLTENDSCASGDIAVNYGNTSSKGLCEFSVCSRGEYVGAGAIVYLPQGDVCYLKWIYIEGTHQGKGFASAALSRIFADLYRRGIKRIDTDTADGNLIAQRLYVKTGFEDMGRTRSYLK